MAEEYLIRMDDISKHYGGVYALDHVQFRLKPGEVHALVGENGAGKSTLIKILAGAIEKDGGTVYMNGEELKINGPFEAMAAGISTVYQELVLAPELSVAENIFLHQYRKGNIVNWKQMNAETQKLLDELQFTSIRPKDIVGNLSIASQQIVEICKALSHQCKVLILDEPTAVLMQGEVEQLFRIVRQLKEQGISIIYISHRMEELTEICDRLTVFRDGKYIGEANVADVTEEEIISMMTGREFEDMYPVRSPKIGETVLEAKNIVCGKMVQDVSFSVRKGEILGVGGLVGAGRTETMRAIFGADKKESGEVFIDGKKVNIRSPKDAIRCGLGMLSEDRKGEGVVLEIPISQNITLTALDSITNALGVFNGGKEKEMVDQYIEKLRIKLGSPSDPVSSLSGGNQQKVSIAKWLASKCRVIVFDEPTRGVDVGAKQEIFKLIDDLAMEGIAIIMISSYMPELLGMCDRIIIMHDGRITGELAGDEATEELIMKHALG